MDESCSVVVIGAGFAGVTAARDLSQAGHSVIVLEARDRIGGRTYADDGIGRRVELGGAYCHWTQADIWRETRRYGLELGAPDLEERIVYHADGELHTTDLEGADAGLAPGMDAFFGDALEYFPLPWNLDAVDYTKVDEETIAERIAGLDVSDAERDFFDGAIAYGIAWPKEAAVSHLLRWVGNYSGNWRATFEAGSYWRIASGTKSLLDAMAADSDADFRLSTPVSAVEDSGDGVVVTTRSGDTVRAEAAIVAVPLNAMSAIEFSPELRGPTRQLIDEGNPMLSRKFWARVKGDKGFTGYAPLGANPITNALAEYSLDGDTLFACFGPAGPGFEFDQTDVAAVQEALRFWDPEVEVVAVDGHDWVEDEFSQGTWMMFRPGQMKNLLPDIQKPHGRINFAGGDIAPFFPGWIQGAIESGAVTAQSVAEELKGSLSSTAS